MHLHIIQMNKSQIIINGVRAAEFVLVRKYGRNILNNLVVVLRDIGDRKPMHRNQFELPTKKFKYKIGDAIYYDRIIWRGFYIGHTPPTNVLKYHIYIDEDHRIKLINI